MTFTDIRWKLRPWSRDYKHFATIDRHHSDQNRTQVLQYQMRNACGDNWMRANVSSAKMSVLMCLDVIYQSWGAQKRADRLDSNSKRFWFKFWVNSRRWVLYFLYCLWLYGTRSWILSRALEGGGLFFSAPHRNFEPPFSPPLLKIYNYGLWRQLLFVSFLHWYHQTNIPTFATSRQRWKKLQ